MATATDVARAAAELHRKIAQDLDDAPTGVVPGYDANSGATYLPNGRVRYRRGAAAPGLMAIYSEGGGFSLPNGSNRINFATLVYDPNGLVTTGATTWAFTAPVDGWYAFTATVYVSAASAIYPADASMELNVRTPAGGSATQAVRLDYRQTPVATSSSYIFFFGGTGVLHLAAAATASIRLFNNNATTRQTLVGDGNRATISLITPG